MAWIETRFPINIDLETTLFCGQTFLWKRADGGYYACIDGNPVSVFSEEGGLVVRSTGGNWAHYFDLERDYEKIAEKYESDKYVSGAYSAFSGLRVLNQPVWETLCSFIISANNNIKRITGIIDRLCLTLGGSGGTCLEPGAAPAFPLPADIVNAGESILRSIGLGYRAEYLFDTAKRVYEGYDLEKLRSVGYEQAQRELVSFKGVGEKVADCVLLFSCGYREAFPVDVWIARVMKELYSVDGSIRAVKAAGKQLFGNDAGIAQQWLFHGARTGLFTEINA